jgi:hypothetical protein
MSSTHQCRLLSLFSLLVLAAPGQAQQFTPQVQEFITVKAPSVALTDAKVIDGTGKPAQLHQTVLLQRTDGVAALAGE